ncbi:unnamed protein product [Symbiodinium natans]|uniref:Uncharacterized protein n=1 Tax=Symbiodinium natans TaxID=878477 RepID=A0A812QH80_9DINO|nr:unnamed protein product [Symbiodinium natans]
MGCNSSMTVPALEVVVQDGKAAKALFEFCRKDEKAARLSRAHRRPVDMDSSWDFERTPIAVPYGMSVRHAPTRKLHERHLEKLNRFLAGVEHQPQVLEDMINKRRGSLSAWAVLLEESEGVGEHVKLTL